MEQWRGFLQEGKFELKDDPEFFRVPMPGIGSAQGQQHLRFKARQSDVDRPMATPAFLNAKAKYETNKNTKDITNEQHGH